MWSLSQGEGKESRKNYKRRQELLHNGFFTPAEKFRKKIYFNKVCRVCGVFLRRKEKKGNGRRCHQAAGLDPGQCWAGGPVYAHSHPVSILWLMDRERWEAYEREHTPNTLEEGVELVLCYLEAVINRTAAQVAGSPAQEAGVPLSSARKGGARAFSDQKGGARAFSTRKGGAGASSAQKGSYLCLHSLHHWEESSRSCLCLHRQRESSRSCLCLHRQRETGYCSRLHRQGRKQPFRYWSVPPAVSTSADSITTGSISASSGSVGGRTHPAVSSYADSIASSSLATGNIAAHEPLEVPVLGLGL
ncbi:UNVERIFIED_CONTAM: hypothetical protein FKN15_056401 [Acipenser sinensis]